MTLFHNILVGAFPSHDGDSLSIGTRKAAEQAQALATALDVPVTLFHSRWKGDSQEPYDEEAVTAELEALVTSLEGAGVSAQLALGDDRPWRSIIRRVVDGKHDLVVIGKRPSSSGTRFRLATNAKKLLSSCPCPVWIVQPDREPVSKLVLAATDLTETGDYAARLAAGVSKTIGAELHVVHAFHVPVELQMERSAMTTAEYREQMSELRDSLKAHIVGALQDHERAAQIHLGCTSPERAILECVKHDHPDLLVMGVISRGGIPGLFVGTTAEEILDDVDCSLLVVKPKNFHVPPLA